jgi:hypothetical protein
LEEPGRGHGDLVRRNSDKLRKQSTSNVLRLLRLNQLRPRCCEFGFRPRNVCAWPQLGVSLRPNRLQKRLCAVYTRLRCSNSFLFGYECEERISGCH